MLNVIETINSAVNNFVWGVPAMICIFGVGLYLSIRTGFLQIRKFPYAMRTTLGRVFRKREASDGALTPFQAVCTALAATVGTGNIAGVAGAIAIGGPGAVFWMWISALLGMCTKFRAPEFPYHRSGFGLHEQSVPRHPDRGRGGTCPAWRDQADRKRDRKTRSVHGALLYYTRSRRSHYELSKHPCRICFHHFGSISSVRRYRRCCRQYVPEYEKRSVPRYFLQ